jgi:hypothetical protein
LLLHLLHLLHLGLLMVRYILLFVISPWILSSWTLYIYSMHHFSSCLAYWIIAGIYTEKWCRL